ncbi:MAG TPA: bifunctional diaminohydroxyphosphoribosylaminopyrimidine deaminase/5-amino-6-(5-phosphoribosylamino)uracil reductase RibD [Mycobacteriales bacterium]|jgi:diaminohydroxyphosphoribosylaminopyrimidine deaminase/5-amino-6-(5-phosphoribosylamino)uracil reductase|nr:bifunctional diaminohydroxyphosphoribosylaminopyrimidine deaminase/5-amino-6-(5-phosphoribosylamino)uracil reductase RibD [Mycobacteriales bacterium]
MATAAETAAMRRAIEVAQAALGTTNPNPAVGAVVLGRDGDVVGEGATAPIGGPHAEVVALAAAGERAAGGCLVVTLEPCAHHGRTGPCTDAIVAAEVRRVVYAVGDPHDIAGGGGRRLGDAGLDVESGLLAAEATVDLEPWLSAVRRGRPFVTWKYAATLDGRTAAADRTSRWISGEESRADVHVLRARSDAVVVGIGTVLADDPALTARGPAVARQPLRVVVDSDARTPTGAKVLDDAAKTLIAVAVDAPGGRREALRAAGAELVELPRSSSGVDLQGLLDELRVRERHLVLLEGGATLAAGFLQRERVDRVVAYIAPALLGEGAPVVGAFGVSTITDAARLELRGVSALGDDVRIVADVRRGGGN